MLLANSSGFAVPLSPPEIDALAYDVCVRERKKESERVPVRERRREGERRREREGEREVTDDDETRVDCHMPRQVATPSINT